MRLPRATPTTSCARPRAKPKSTGFRLRCWPPGSVQPQVPSPWTSKTPPPLPPWRKTSSGTPKAPWWAFPALQHSNTPTLLHSPFWLPKEWDLALHQRKGALFLNEGYPLTLDEEFAFELPTKVQVFELPGLAENDQEPLRWRIEWANGS